MGNFMGMCLSNLCLFQRLYDVSSKKYQIEKLPQKKGNCIAMPARFTSKI